MNGLAPSGKQVEIISGDQRAVVTEVGGALRKYESGSWRVLDGFGEEEMSPAGHGQLLIPWPNRLKDGGYRFGDGEHQTPLSEPDQGNAIHGLVRWANWSVSRPDDRHARASYVLHPQVGYPFVLGLEVAYELSSTGLKVTITATNLGSGALPYGAGQHPYFSVGTDLVDYAVLQVPATAILETDERGIPTGRELDVTDGPLDYRRPRTIGPTVMDTCYTRLERDAERRAKVTLAREGDSPRLTVWMDEHFDFAMIFTGDTLGPDRRRRSVAIEPMTCAPDSFHNGAGLQILQPRSRMEATWGVSLEM